VAGSGPAARLPRPLFCVTGGYGDMLALAAIAGQRRQSMDPGAILRSGADVRTAVRGWGSLSCNVTGLGGSLLHAVNAIF